jgi:pyruvate,water dikinase
VKKRNNSGRNIDVSEKYVKWFSELSNKDVGIAGGKGASLAEMYNAKFPVPPGFVVTAQAFDYFMTASGLRRRIISMVEEIDMENTEQIRQKSSEIRELIEKTQMPDDLKKEIIEAYHIMDYTKIDERGVSKDALNILKNAKEPLFVSVRSSATTEDLEEASFAGQQDTFLNIKGDERLIEHIKKCISSLYTARAMYYRRKQGFKEAEALLAVVVQKMVDSAKSGVVFSRDPVTLTEDVAVEAVFGLGEGVVSGKIRPDHYIIGRNLEIKSVKVADKKIAIVRNSSGNNEAVQLTPEKSRQQAMTTSEIKEIANYAIKLEEYYKKPQDIEFAIEDKIYIVQSRPITTLQKGAKKVGVLTGNVIVTGLGSSPGIGVGPVRLIRTMDDLAKIKKGDVLVTEMTNPDMVVSMAKSVAIVTDEGGMTSHAAIVSREMGIPCIVGTGDATSVLKEGMRITVDGSNGKVYEGEVAETTITEIKPALKTERIELKLIVDLPDFAERAAETGIENIGLTRLEGIIASLGKHPILYEKEGKIDDYNELIRAGIEKIAKPFKKIWIRSSDIRTDEYGSLKGAPEKEINPMLGLHGIRFSLKHPKIFEAELSAVKKVAENHPDKRFGIMFPQVISIEEVREAKEHFKRYKTPNMDFGVMIETPASVQIIDEICEEGVDFISLGTNDLTQYTLAVDRGEDEVQYLYNEMHPAIFSQIKRVIGACRRHRVETSICGQAGSREEMVRFLFRKGISSISVNADAAYNISKLIKDLEEERKQYLATELELQKTQMQSPQPKPQQTQSQQQNKQQNQNKQFNKKPKFNQQFQKPKPQLQKFQQQKQNKPQPTLPNNPNHYNPKNQSQNPGQRNYTGMGNSNQQPIPVPEPPKPAPNPLPPQPKPPEENQKKMLNRNNIKFHAEEIKSEDSVSKMDDYERLSEKAEDIEERVEKQSEKREEKVDRVEKNIQIEKEYQENESAESEENIGVYAPESEEEQAPKQDYNFDDDFEEL